MKAIVHTMSRHRRQELVAQCKTVTIEGKRSELDDRWSRTTNEEWARKVLSQPGGRIIALRKLVAGNFSFLRNCALRLRVRLRVDRKLEKKTKVKN